MAQNTLGPGLSSTGTGGDGVDGYSTEGSGGAGTGTSGVYGFAASPAAGNAGVLGDVYYVSNTYGTVLKTGPGFVAGV